MARGSYKRSRCNWRQRSNGLNFGRGLPRALVCKGVPVASVGNLDTYGLLPDIANERARINALESFSLMYGPAAGKDVIADALSRAGSDALVGADALRTAPEQYSSTIEYAGNPLSKNLKSAGPKSCPLISVQESSIPATEVLIPTAMSFKAR
ncbi:MAG: hypothetical protein CM1200mP27_08520 [Chloroflexota bacterium]|nr:MAG: hypothetical protein CM1200mP27_08520 [Chloroflexota bacterium]